MPNRLVIALDNLSKDRLIEIVSELKKDEKNTRRIILKLNDFIALHGFLGIKEILGSSGFQLMLDTKWHDIPNTVSNYIAQIANSGLAGEVEYVTIHASGGKEMLASAVKKRNELGLPTKILAITALTSLQNSDTLSVYGLSPRETVLNLAKIAYEAGVDGLVCSSEEASFLKNTFGTSFLLVTPGVRFEGEETHDQKRVTTPQKAIQNGADDVVMGRGILHGNIGANIERFFREIEGQSFISSESTLGRDFVSWVLSIKAIEIIPEGRTTKSGRLTPYFFNAGLFNTGATISRLGYFYAQTLAASGIEYDVLFGPAYKGITLASSTATHLGKLGKPDSFAFNRKEAKDHGEGGVIVGGSIQGKRVAIIDDVITDGGAKREAIEIIKANGGIPVCIVIAFDREERGLNSPLSGLQQISKDYNLPVLSIATTTDLIQILPDEEIKEKIKDYLRQYGVGKI